MLIFSKKDPWSFGMVLSFLPLGKKLSEAWRVTEAETEHLNLIPSGAVSYIWGKIFKVFFTVLKVVLFSFLSIQRNTHTFKQIHKNSKRSGFVCVCHMRTGIHETAFHWIFLLIIAEGWKRKIFICCTSESNLLLSCAFGRREHS